MTKEYCTGKDVEGSGAVLIFVWRYWGKPLCASVMIADVRDGNLDPEPHDQSDGRAVYVAGVK